MAPLLRLSAPILIAAGIALACVAPPALAASALAAGGVHVLRPPAAPGAETAGITQLAAHRTRQSRRQRNRSFRRRNAARQRELQRRRLRQRELERRRLRQRYPYGGRRWTNPRTGALCWINRKGQRQCYEGH